MERAIASTELPTTQLAAGLEFPEGPVWMPDGAVILVEIKRGTLTRVAADGHVDVVAACGGGPNGAALGPDGKMYVCNNGGFEWSTISGLTVPGNQAADYAGGSIQRVDVETGEVEELYTHVDGHRLCGPNDLVFDGEGGFWFTDHGKNRPRERDRGGLYYAKVDGSHVEELVHPLMSPNGVGLSPRGDRVYAADTHEGSVHVWDLEGPGQIAGYKGKHHRGGLLANPGGGMLFDSLAVDGDGNVCVATLRRGGILVIPPTGTEPRHFSTNDPFTTNICFGGEDLATAFITLSGTGQLVCCDWETPGLALAY